jgi:hypothetical protein
VFIVISDYNNSPLMWMYLSEKHQIHQGAHSNGSLALMCKRYARKS